MKRCAWCKCVELGVLTTECCLPLCCICMDEHNRDCTECREIVEYHEQADYDHDRSREEDN